MSGESTQRLDVDSNADSSSRFGSVKKKTRRCVESKSSRSPSFLKLIRELRARFPIERQIKADLVNYDEDDGICHETGERLSHLHIDQARSVLANKQKGVSFTPHTLAISALTESSVSELEKLLDEQSIDVNFSDEHGDTLLHKAAFEGDVDCIRVLVNHGANVNVKNKDGWPPVHCALRQGNLSAMVYLIECGTDMNDYTQLRVHEIQSVEKLSKTISKGEEIFV